MDKSSRRSRLVLLTNNGLPIYGTVYSIDMIRQATYAARSRRTRYALLGISALCALLVVGVFIAAFVLYYLRYRHAVVSSLTYPYFVCSERPCGCPNLKPERLSMGRIVGGEETAPYTYPWLVGLVDRARTEPFCAGFIIAPNIVLTAAHCLKSRAFNQVQILSRMHDLRHFHGDRHNVDQWAIHAEYRANDNRHLNDIALIRINGTFASDLQPVCLPAVDSPDNYPSARTTAVVSGWGTLATRPHSRSSPVLQHAVIPIVDHKNNRCRMSIANDLRQVCAGYDSLAIDACSGDSGAPLLVVDYNAAGDQGSFVAGGIVSYGNKQCDASISSGVYTRVSFYVPWIQTTTAHLS